VAGAPAHERAVELIPELMGRILDSQEEIRETESEIAPVVRRQDEQLTDAKQRIDASATEAEAAEALVDYVEAYAARLETQEEGLRAIEGPIVRMRADSRELRYAAEVAGRGRDAPEERQSFNQDQFQGVASGMQGLAGRLGREAEAATAGSVLHDSWAAQRAFGLPIPEFGPGGADAFARKIEGLFARHQARTNQLRAERRSVRRRRRRRAARSLLGPRQVGGLAGPEPPGGSRPRPSVGGWPELRAPRPAARPARVLLPRPAPQLEETSCTGSATGFPSLLWRPWSRRPCSR
jgi:hypothetical protein